MLDFRQQGWGPKYYLGKLHSFAKMIPALVSSDPLGSICGLWLWTELQQACR
jgi:hypothetical protein